MVAPLLCMGIEVYCTNRTVSVSMGVHAPFGRGARTALPERRYPGTPCRDRARNVLSERRALFQCPLVGLLGTGPGLECR